MNAWCVTLTQLCNCFLVPHSPPLRHRVWGCHLVQTTEPAFVVDPVEERLLVRTPLTLCLLFCDMCESCAQSYQTDLDAILSRFEMLTKV